MSNRSRHHDRHRVRRDRRRQHARAWASRSHADADLWLGFWGNVDDLLVQYAMAGCADGVRTFLAANPETTVDALTHAASAAGEAWPAVTLDDRHHYIATLEALLAAGADASVLAPDVMAVLPSRCARALDAELPASSFTTPRGSRL